MPHIDTDIIIRANRRQVFDLIERAEEFAAYSKYIEQVDNLGDGTHQWRVCLAGICLEWTSVFTERQRPTRLAWRSVAGIENFGSYDFVSNESGTMVAFNMDYHLPSRILDKVAAPVMESLILAAVTQVLEGLKGRLENDPDVDWCPSDETGNCRKMS